MPGSCVESFGCAGLLLAGALFTPELTFVACDASPPIVLVCVALLAGVFCRVDGEFALGGRIVEFVGGVVEMPLAAAGEAMMETVGRFNRTSLAAREWQGDGGCFLGERDVKVKTPELEGRGSFSTAAKLPGVDQARVYGGCR